MSRILIAWELGLNLGHLARLLPIAQRLKQRGHIVLVAARDTRTAAALLAPAGIPLTAAPCLSQSTPTTHPLTTYADILLTQGWNDNQTLIKLVSGWRQLFSEFQPDLMVVDHAPTALLAARSDRISTAQIGNGFEIPPAISPLPRFPGLPIAPATNSMASESTALHHANAILKKFNAAPLNALHELFDPQRCRFTTFAELDHYGARPAAYYAGPLLGQFHCAAIEWPAKKTTKIFAALRPDTANIDVILDALATCDASVICFAPSFAAKQLARLQSPTLRFSQQPLQLQPLLREASLCLSYGAEGTIARFLLAGVPQLLAPRWTEAHLAARRIEEFGAGIVLRGAQSVASVAIALRQLIDDPHCRQRAQVFAERYRDYDSEEVAERLVDWLEGWAI